MTCKNTVSVREAEHTLIYTAPHFWCFIWTFWALNVKAPSSETTLLSRQEHIEINPIIYSNMAWKCGESQYCGVSSSFSSFHWSSRGLSCFQPHGVGLSSPSPPDKLSFSLWWTFCLPFCLHGFIVNKAMAQLFSNVTAGMALKTSRPLRGHSEVSEQ